MRRLVLVVSLLLASLPVAAFAHGGTEVSVVGSVRVDGSIELTGEEFAVGDVVRIVLRRGAESLELGRVPVEASGDFRATLHIPASVAAGLYVLAAEGIESATTEVAILESATSAPAARSVGAESGPISNDRPADETAGLALFTVVAALAGAALLWRSGGTLRASS